MRVLITPALPLSDDEKDALRQQHTLFFLEDERLPLTEQALSFDPADIDAIVCNFFFQHNGLDALPHLKAIQLTSAGLDRVPLDDIAAAGISLFNAGATYAVPMAEWALTKILELFKQSAAFADAQQRRAWEKQRRIRELAGCHAVVVGFGNVGREVAKRLRAFDVAITAVDIAAPQGHYDHYAHIAQLDEVLPSADIVVLTVPLTDATRGLMDRRRLSYMKPDAVLVNIARGGIVDETALAEALTSGTLTGAALDVFETEPLSPAHPLWDCPHLLLSPHNSFVGNGNHARLLALVENNLGTIQ